MNSWISFMMLSLIPFAFSKRAHFLQTGFLDETVVESNGFGTTSSTYTLVQCARSCTGLCTRFRFCQKRPGELGQCNTYTSGRSCVRHELDPDFLCSCYMLEYSKDENGTCTCPVGYLSDGSSCCNSVIQDCSEGQAYPHLKDRGNLLSFIKPNSSHDKPFEVLCHFGYGGLVYIQRRVHNAKYVDFNRSWEEYNHGFGHPEGNHWLGFDKINLLLQIQHVSFQLDLEFLYWKKCIVYYKNFNFISFEDFAFHGDHGVHPQNEWCGYVSINNLPFSTFDRDSTQFDCPSTFAAGWWYQNGSICTRSSMNGPFEETEGQTKRILLDKNNPGHFAEEVSIKLKRLK